ncbi:hypothetical protein E7T06_05845 [Deinococcus sp. Arct2-2]|uniref:hypothetical protein n=1 Tax=Deinococcus sp. Arct2-2 TaxID=2568653 RepID=UPI0010A2C96D|nr:hypothetical protein [Deinococcus sp. Arct2-2]THF70865.1 hypothetical protein E7T06_05845 [Deinococcus sp. Arct2-2]
MKSIAHLNLVGTIVSDPAFRIISGTTFAKTNFALDSIGNGRKITNELPLTFFTEKIASSARRASVQSPDVAATYPSGRTSSAVRLRGSKIKLGPAATCASVSCVAAVMSRAGPRTR